MRWIRHGGGVLVSGIPGQRRRESANPSAALRVSVSRKRGIQPSFRPRRHSSGLSVLVFGGLCGHACQRRSEMVDGHAGSTEKGLGWMNIKNCESLKTKVLSRVEGRLK